MPFNVRYMGHQNQLEVQTERFGRKLFPRGQVVSVRGFEGQQLLRQKNLQFERVMPGDAAFGEAVDLETLARPSDPVEPEP